MLKTISLVLLLSSPALAGTIDQPVVGGTESAPGAWPDLVAVLAPTAACSGTLIAPDVVLTAGHCIGIRPVEVVVGTVDFAAPGGGGQVIAVRSATAYPDWQHTYDVGVLVLEHPAGAMPRTITSACTAEADLVAGAKVEVVGFGLTTRTGTGSNTRLHQAAIAIDDPMCTGDPSCASAVAPGGEFVAGGHGTDACFGDSGGPVFGPSSKGPVLLGVVSRALGTSQVPCGDGGVFVRADKVVAWIEHLTGRKLARSSCAGKGDDGGDQDQAEAAGGCAVGGGALGGAVAVALGTLWLLTRRNEARLRS